MQVVIAVQHVDEVRREAGSESASMAPRTSVASSMVPTTRSVGYGMNAFSPRRVSAPMIAARVVRYE